MIFMEF